MNPTEYGTHLAETAPAITAEQADAAARIFVSMQSEQVAA